MQSKLSDRKRLQEDPSGQWWHYYMDSSVIWMNARIYCDASCFLYLNVAELADLLISLLDGNFFGSVNALLGKVGHLLVLALESQC